MNVHLTPELEQMIQSKIKSGRYNSASEVMCKALQLMNEYDLAREEVRKKIAEGLESLRMGKGVDGETFFAQMESELDDEIRSKDEMKHAINL